MLYFENLLSYFKLHQISTFQTYSFSSSSICHRLYCFCFKGYDLLTLSIFMTFLVCANPLSFDFHFTHFSFRISITHVNLILSQIVLSKCLNISFICQVCILFLFLHTAMYIDYIEMKCLLKGLKFEIYPRRFLITETRILNLNLRSNN